MNKTINEYRSLCELYRIKKKKEYQFFDLRQNKGIVTVLWYGIHKDKTATTKMVLRSKYKQFNKSLLQAEIVIMKLKLAEK